MGLRRKSREAALQFLFSHDFRGFAADPEVVAAELSRFNVNFEVAKKSVAYADQLVTGICGHLAEIDQLLTEHSHNWRLERMSAVDRNILRIAAYEMRYAPEVPDSVAINEALEIAKRYSLADSVAFINGILDAIAASGEKIISDSTINGTD